MNTKRKLVAIAHAYYQGESVDVLDVVYNPSKGGQAEYLINYGGPIWVNADELNQLIFGD